MQTLSKAIWFMSLNGFAVFFIVSGGCNGTYQKIKVTKNIELLKMKKYGIFRLKPAEIFLTIKINQGQHSAKQRGAL